ncbi:thymidylate synthase (FAD) [Candidatus Bathyarchaeota archaeon]|jgi:thymidylate synthase (FAD)|nr:thymidylate synthase (FAD) [Candidatus Bathyarchaeota archaeon]MDP6048165.1 FAD-dependent thymidylate synthase [Candidatus Bathyarchaeota archaeon]MDP7207266.1 FAD-dependent thymidylate synthase [Candidatus Bathyarchaeota archaeon]MDP7442845.1 FAD-dependent thymidylate synthase [Candidatus Bathyarchaeota archaeon]
MKAELLSHTPIERLKKNAKEGLTDNDLLSHTAFTFAIEGISRACSHQLVRHRVASYSQQSQRYITEKKLREKIVTPSSIGERSEIFRDLVEASGEAYGKLVESGVPKEDARFVLPNAAETSMIMTMDGESLNHFFGLRCCERAQWEIRDLADAMLLEVIAVAPSLFKETGPYCSQRGYCTEGRFTCNRINEVKEQYKELRERS